MLYSIHMEKLTYEFPVWSDTGFIRGHLSRRDLFGFTPLWEKYWDLALLWKGQGPSQRFAITSLCKHVLHNTHTHTCMHAETPLTHGFSPIILQGFPLLMHIHLKTDFIQVNELSCTCLWYKALVLVMWICWQMWAFFLLCVFLSLVHTPGAAQHFVFWHSGSNNHSSSAQTNICCQKHPTQAQRLTQEMSGW